MKKTNFTFHATKERNWKLLLKSCYSFLLVVFCLFLSTQNALAQPLCTLNADVGEVTDVTCNGDTDGSIDINAEVSVSTLLPRVILYDWGPAIPIATRFNQDQAGLAPGNYSVTITEVSPPIFPILPQIVHCVKIVDATVGEPAALSAEVAVGGINNVTCNGGSDGDIYIDVQGGTPPYNYFWAGPTAADNTQDAVDIPAGTYDFAVVDANGCRFEIDDIVVTEPTPVTVAIAVDQNADCQGNETGQATATAAGGDGGPYTYAWSNGDAAATAEDLHAGGYVVTATDASGCTAVAATSITDPNGLAFVVIVTNDVSCNGGNDGSGTVAIDFGTPPYTVAQRIDPQGVVTGLNTPIFDGFVFDNLTAGTWGFVARDFNGCLFSTTASIAEPTLLIAETIATTDALCNGSLDGTATVNATGGTTPYTYAWSSGAATATATGLAADTYMVTVTDANGCEAITTATVGEPTAILATTSSTTNVTCNGGSDGAIEITVNGGTAPYSYLWSGNIPADDVQDALNIPAGTYNVLITDANGCQARITNINITEPSPVTVTIGGEVNADCAGNETGRATATASGGTGAIYNFAWSNGQNGTNQATATGLHAGGYSVTVTDENGCTAQASTSISDPNGLTAIVTNTTDASCNGAADGSVTIVVNGGTLAYTFDAPLVATGPNNATATGLAAGSYVFSATDANGCPVSVSAQVDEPTLLIADVTTKTDITCNGADDGTATVIATGGTTPYTYLWNDLAAQTTVTATGLAPGAYMVQVTDSNGCVTFQTVEILEPAVLTLSTPETLDVTCNGGKDGKIFTQVAGGTGPYNYDWSGFQNAAGGLFQPADNVQDQEALTAGTYTVQVTDANGCTFTINDIVINEPTLLTVAISDETNADCIGNETGSALATAAGGTAPYTYAWSNGQNVDEATGLHAGGYVVIATDANGCTAQAATSITDPNGLLFGITESTDVTCNGGADGSATFGIIGGTAPYELFGFIGPDGTQVNLNAAPVPVVTGTVYPGLSAGLYAFFVRDANGCITANNINIHEPTLLIAEIVHQEDESCEDANDGSATVNATGGTTGYTYLWSDGQTANTAVGLTAGTYTVTTTDANGCTAEVSVVIITNDEIPPLFTTTIPGDITVECDAIPAPFVLDAAAWHVMDNCSDATDITIAYTETQIDIVCPNTYTLKRQWLITDEAGNTAVHIRNVRVQDTTKPTFTVPANVTIECDESTLPANTGDVTDQMDNCSDAANVVVAYTDVEDYSGCGGYTGTITRTWTATDECGNVETKVQIITIVDTTMPVALCNSFTVELDAAGQASITVAQVDNGSTDNCATLAQLTYSLDKMDFTCADIGANIVTLSVTDPCGNTGTCEATITVEDNILPVITCPGDIVINLASGECEEVISYAVTATDNCDVDVAQIGDLTFTSGDAFPIGGPYILTYEATDEGGNAVQCSFSVTVNEYVPLENDISCIGDVNISLDGSCTALVTADEILAGNDYGCFDDFIITITDANGAIVAGNLLNQSHVNTVLEVSVLDPDSGLSCWGNILVEDKLVPEIECPADYDATCIGSTVPAITGFPTLLTCEASSTTTFEDVYTEFDCAGSPMDATVRARIIRTWTVVDGSGNSTSCVQTIRILKPLLTEVTFPADRDEIGGNALECDEVGANPLLTTPAFTGFPIYDGADVTPGGLCAFSIGYTDIELEICAGGSSYEILRTWTVRNMCEPLVAGVNPRQHIQSIKVLDTKGPDMLCPADITVGTSSNSCTAAVALPAAQISDACSNPVSTVITASGGTLVGSTLTNLELGTYTVTYTSTDACGNTNACSFDITVEDNVAPIAVCDEHTIVGIGSDGTALVNALTFDDGSFDNCGPVTLDARRMDNPDCPGNDATAFDATVPFTCCDAGSIVMVELRATDAAGNTNSCMVEVQVQDKIRPEITCPANKTIECTDDISPAFTGTAVATDNCGEPVVTYVDISNTVDDCGVGTIRRSWTARVDNTIYGSSNCIQTITVINSDPFVITDTECRRFPLNTPQHTLADDVEWPCDIELNTCGLGLTPDDLDLNGNNNPITGQQINLDARPSIVENACENVAVTYEDTQLDFGAGDACLKVLRKWIIINWCDVANNQDPTVAGPGVYHYVQVIKVLNSTAPVIETFNGATTIDNFSGSTQTNNPNDACGTAFVAFDITASDDCSAQSDLVYTWAFSTGTSGTGTSASGAFANGDYSVTFSVSDQCGNTSTETKDFTVRDAKKPTPVCIFGIASTIMPSAGQVTIWASDFESGSSFDNCTPYNQLEFSFSQDITDKSIVIECEDIPANGLYPITLYVTDAYGNFDFCSTFINVQDPNGACGIPTAVINGEIKNEFDETVEEVTVTLSDDNGLTMPVVTGADGAFEFANMAYGDYDVTAEKDLNHLNGVTTFDLVLISKHILGVELLDSPYKVIAADANNSESVTTLDIVKLRALILHINDELANNTSWRFVDAGFTFADANNPWATTFPEYVALDNSVVPVNFTAIKVGDVNGSASPNNLLGSTTRNFNGNLALQLATTEVAAGETFTVDFTAKDFNNIAGYQFSLGFDNSAVEFVDVTTSLEGLSTANFGLTKLNEGVITTSWNTAEAVSLENDATLFSLTFVANQAINTKALFSINSRYTETEAYSGADLYNVSLEFNGQAATSQFELYQNTPNPFKAETSISFNLPEAGTVTLKIYDVAGRTLRLMEMDAAQGINSVEINRADFDATGVLYYQLETATETATKKMILVD